MAYSTTASFDKLTCTNSVDFENCQDSFGRFCLSKNDSNYLDVKLSVFKRDKNRDFPLVQKLTVGEAVFNRFVRFRKQLVIASENFRREVNMSPVLIPTKSKDLDEHLKLAHKVINLADQAIRKNCVTLLWNNVEKPGSSYAQAQKSAKEKEEKKFKQIVFVQ